MNKRVYQQPTMKVVKLQHKNHILAGSVTDVAGNANLLYGGAGGSHEAGSRSNRGFDVWDDWDEE